MSLLRLLTAGKSLIGVEQVAGRYQMTDPRSMPKFGQGRNPFQARKGKGTEGSGQKTEDRDQRSGKVEKTTEPVAVKVSEPSTPPKPMAKMKSAPTEPGPVAVKASGPKRGWISKLGSLKKILRRDAGGTSRPARELRPVQGELSLDKIKVVRNDLSESDLEVVPLRSGATARNDQCPEKAVCQAGLALSEANRS